MTKPDLSAARAAIAAHAPAFARFATVGLINTVVDMSVFSALHFGLDVGLVASNVGAFVVAVGNSFVLNRRWTFANRRGSGGLAQQLPTFLVLNTIGLGISTATLSAFSEFMPVLAAKVIAIGVTCVWNYVSIRRFVYSRPA